MGFFANDLIATTPLNLSTWNHITWVYNQAAATQTIFVNGLQIATRNAAGFTGTDPLLIGRAFSGLSAEFFAGSIDGARIFNRALSAAEVATNMFDGVPLGGPDVTANYRFNDGSGTIAVDSSVYSRPGTLSGGAVFSTITNVPWTLTGAVTTNGTSAPISFTAADEELQPRRCWVTFSQSSSVTSPRL